MSSAEARYFRVGAFVFTGLALAVSGIVVLGGGRLLERPVRFETYFDESVQGLEIGSPVKQRGVQIGRVAAIDVVDEIYRFDSEEERLSYGQRVRVVMELRDAGEADYDNEENAARLQRMIDRGLRLRITTQGITGVSFIEADFLSPEQHPPMKITWEPRYFYVPSAPSMFTAITTAAERIFQRLEQVEVERVVKNLDGLILALTAKVEAFDVDELHDEGVRLLAELRTTNDELRAALAGADLPTLSADARKALVRVDGTLLRAQRTIDGSQQDLGQTIENLRVTSENLRDLTDTLRAQPSLLLRSAAPPEGGSP